MGAESYTLKVYDSLFLMTKTFETNREEKFFNITTRLRFLQAMQEYKNEVFSRNDLEKEANLPSKLINTYLTEYLSESVIEYSNNRFRFTDYYRESSTQPFWRGGIDSIELRIGNLKRAKQEIQDRPLVLSNYRHPSKSEGKLIDYILFLYGQYNCFNGYDLHLSSLIPKTTIYRLLEKYQYDEIISFTTHSYYQSSNAKNYKVTSAGHKFLINRLEEFKQAEAIKEEDAQNSNNNQYTLSPEELDLRYKQYLLKQMESLHKIHNELELDEKDLLHREISKILYHWSRKVKLPSKLN